MLEGHINTVVTAYCFTGYFTLSISLTGWSASVVGNCQNENVH